MHMNRDMVDAFFSNVGSYELIVKGSHYQPTLVGYMVFFGGLFAVRGDAVRRCALANRVQVGGNVHNHPVAEFAAG